MICKGCGQAHPAEILCRVAVFKCLAALEDELRERRSRKSLAQADAICWLMGFDAREKNPDKVSEEVSGFEGFWDPTP